MNLDWVGPVVTAVGAVLVAIVGATLAERFTLRRLERVDRIISETNLEGDHRVLLEDVRNRLVERVAYRELRPTLARYFVFGVLLMVGGLFILVLWSIDTQARISGRPSEFSGEVGGTVLFLGTAFASGGGFILLGLLAERRVWAMRNLPSQKGELERLRDAQRPWKRRRRKPDEDQPASEEGGSYDEAAAANPAARLSSSE